MEDRRVPVLELRHISKSYRSGDQELPVLRGTDFLIRSGDFAVILGKSGSGKTTLLHIMAGILTPDEGEVWVRGSRLGTSERELRRYRREKVGLIFQDYGLIDELTVLDNIILAAKMVKDSRDPEALLARFGLSEKKNRYPGQLSGGEKQRTAIARALVKKPDLLLCDEPTGALDEISAGEVMKELSGVNNQGNTVVLITHDTDWSQAATDTYWLEDGRLLRWKQS
ncbi:MAG: ABC transporter ATP-binding protein [Hungatella sp.]|nr:ABC transporter ATP-binding protein [Hungatella sp.]